MKKEPDYLWGKKKKSLSLELMATTNQAAYFSSPGPKSTSSLHPSYFSHKHLFNYYIIQK